jgi:predicted enzyme related to lactoylglutathione lyase
MYGLENHGKKVELHMKRPIHFEIIVPNPENAIEFYKNVFGWEITKWDGPMEYYLCNTGEGDGINGAIMRSEDGVARTVNTIDVPNIDEYIQKIEAHGGKVLMEKQTIPGVGYFASVQDPEGHIFGILEGLKE